MNTIYKLFAWLVLTAAVQADTLNIRQIDRVNDVQQNSQQPLVEWYQGESVEYNALMRRANVAVTLPSDAVPILKAWRSNDLNTLYINVTGTLVNTAGEVQVVLNSTQANLPTGMYAHVVQVWQGTNYMGIAASGALKIHYSPAGNSIAYVGVQTSGAITNLTASGAISATRTGAQVWVTSDAVTNRGASINGSPITNGAAITIGAGSGVTTQIVTGAGSSSRLTVSNGATANVTLNFDAGGLATGTPLYVETGTGTLIAASIANMATVNQWNASVNAVSNQLLAISNALAAVDATALATNLTRGTSWGGSATGSGTNVILRASSVASSNIVDNTITVDDIADDAVEGDKILNDAVTSAKIADGTITNDDINANAAIALSKISGGTNLITGLAASNQFYFAANPSNYQSGAQVSTAIVAAVNTVSNNLRAAVSNEYMAAATVSQNFYRVTNPSNFVSGTLASNIANVAVTNGTASNTTYVAGQLASTVTNTLGELNTNAVRRTGDTHGAMTNRSTLLVQTNVLIAGDSLGSELLTNPNFTSDQSGWALTGGFSWNSGQLLLAAGTSGTVTPSNTPTFSLYSTYRLEYALGQAATVTVTVAMGGETNVYAYAGNGAGVTNVLEIQPRTTQSVVWTFGTASGAPTLRSVSLKKRGIGSLQVAQDVDVGGTVYASNVVAGGTTLTPTNYVLKTGSSIYGTLLFSGDAANVVLTNDVGNYTYIDATILQHDGDDVIDFQTSHFIGNSDTSTTASNSLKLASLSVTNFIRGIYSNGTLVSIASNLNVTGTGFTLSSNTLHLTPSAGSGTFTNLKVGASNNTTVAFLNRSATIRWDNDDTNGLTANVTNLTAGTLIGGSTIATGTPVYADNAGITQVVAGALGGILASNVGGIAYVSATNAAGGSASIPASRAVYVRWNGHTKAYSSTTWDTIAPTNNCVNFEYDPSSCFDTNANGFLYAPGTTGVFMVRMWADEAVGSGRRVAYGMQENGVPVTNSFGNWTSHIGDPYSRYMAVFNDTGAHSSGSANDNPIEILFLCQNATNTYIPTIFPLGNSESSLLNGMLQYIRIGGLD